MLPYESPKPSDVQGDQWFGLQQQTPVTIWRIQVDAGKSVTLLPAPVRQEKRRVVSRPTSGLNDTVVSASKGICEIATSSTDIIFDHCSGFAELFLELVIGELTQ
jgi:hypothetical protein